MIEFGVGDEKLFALLLEKTERSMEEAWRSIEVV